MVCELCRLERRTHWYLHNADYVICDCASCKVPMIVPRRHESTQEEKRAMRRALSDLAEVKYGRGKWTFRAARRVLEHWHMHAVPKEE